MYYWGFFRNLDFSNDENGQLYKVVIITNWKNNELTVGEELLFTDSPFTVEYSTEDDIYKPYKCSTATIGLLQRDINYNFNSATNNNVLVKLLKYKNDETQDNLSLQTSDDTHFTVEWIGFATPNAYSQSYESYYDEFDLECQDALSTLQYYKYETMLSSATVCSFADIIKKWCKYLKTYKHIYITDAVVIPTVDFQDPLHSLYVDERNFFDEDGEPMTVLEVIEHICTYLSITCVPFGDNLYFISYPSIKQGYNDYYEIYYTNNNYVLRQSKTTLEHTHEILGDDFASNGTNLTLLPTYNKLTVKDDFYPYDTILPNLEETDNWEQPLVLDVVDYHPYDYGATVVESTQNVTVINVELDDKKYIYFIRYRNYVNDTTETFNTSYIYTHWYSPDLYDSSNHIFTPQLDNVDSYIIDGKRWNYFSQQNYIGASFVQYQVSEVEDFNDKINSINFSNCIAISTPYNYNSFSTRLGNFQPFTSGCQPVVEWQSNYVVLGSDNYFVISGKFDFLKNSPLIPLSDEDNFKMNPNIEYQWASLRCGGLWWNGEEWIKSARVVRFKLPLEFEKDKKAFGIDIPIVNNISWDMRLNTEGYAIPSPYTDSVRVCNFRFTLYRPFGVYSPREVIPENGVLNKNTITKLTLLKDFDIRIATKNPNEIIDTDDDTDTEYVNVISSGAVEDKDDIELKLTTWDNKCTNYSSILYNPLFHENGYSIFQNPNAYNEAFQRLNVIYGKANASSFGTAEEHIIANNIKQWATPTTQVELNLHNSLDLKPYSKLIYHFFNDKIFIVNGMSVDYRGNVVNLKITEMK